MGAGKSSVPLKNVSSCEAYFWKRGGGNVLVFFFFGLVCGRPEMPEECLVFLLVQLSLKFFLKKIPLCEHNSFWFVLNQIKVF